jgi:hypothetical protein
MKRGIRPKKAILSFFVHSFASEVTRTSIRGAAAIGIYSKGNLRWGANSNVKRNTRQRAAGRVKPWLGNINSFGALVQGNIEENADLRLRTGVA